MQRRQTSVRGQQYIAWGVLVNILRSLITNRRRAVYDRVYYRATRGCLVMVVAMVLGLAAVDVVLAMSV